MILILSPFKKLVLSLVFETAFSFMLQPTSFINYGSSVFQTDIQFSINPFEFSNLLPDENETFKRICLQLIKISSSLQVDESKHREKRILKQKCLV